MQLSKLMTLWTSQKHRTKQIFVEGPVDAIAELKLRRELEDAKDEWEVCIDLSKAQASQADWEHLLNELAAAKRWPVKLKIKRS